MHALPWLVAHGPLVWQLGLALLAAVALGLAFARPRLRARREAAAARAGLGEAAGALAKRGDGVRITLSGTISVDGAPAARFEDGAAAAAASVAYAPQGGAFLTGLNVRAERLALRLGDTTLPLEGPVEVVAGSREAHRSVPLARLPAAVQARIAAGFSHGAPHFRDHVVRLRSVAAGDRVRVSGVLRKEMAVGEGGYRGSSERWALVPDGDASLAALGTSAPTGLRLAAEAAPRVTGPGPGWYARHLAAAALLGAALFGGGGEIALATGRFSLAAATPVRRVEALNRLAAAYDQQHAEDPVEIEARVALHRQRGDCAAEAGTLLGHGLLERAGEVAERCGDHGLAAEAFYAAGDFGRASAALERAPERGREKTLPGALDSHVRFVLRVHLLAGRPALAAAVARTFAAEAEGRVGPTCLAVALEARQSGARPVPLQPAHPACAILYADLHQGQGRLDFIHGLTSFDAEARPVPLRWLELLEIEADPATHPGPVAPPLSDPSLIPAHPEAALVPALPAVERAIAEAAAQPPAAEAWPAPPARRFAIRGPKDVGERPAADPRRATRARFSALAAAFAAIAADAEAARRLSAVAIEAAAPVAPDEQYGRDEENDPWDLRRAQAVAAAVELTLGDVDRAAELLRASQQPWPQPFHVGLGALLTYRTNRNGASLVPHLEGWNLRQDSVSRAYADAAEGDGAALAAWLRRPASEPGSFLRLGAPMVIAGRESLLRWIRLGHRISGWSRSPAAQMVHWTNLAAAARALGDEALGAQLSARAARFRDALLRRDLAVPLAVLERM